MTKICYKALLLCSIVYFTIVFYACSLVVLKENISVGPCWVFFFKVAFEKRDNNEFNLRQADINKCGTNNHTEAHDSDEDIFTPNQTHTYRDVIKSKGR